ncbi:hypothetical protein [Metabacillus fastidiosus]|uniref:hypothetical protein n=1 Tax=Metabacillus fastidiosus TaxID=1458 RepID=UPI003D296E33
MSKKRKKNSFWSDGLSIDETRFSALVLMGVISLGYTLYAHYKTGDITHNLLDLVKVLIFSIVGINVANYITDTIHSRRGNKQSTDYNEVEENVYKDNNGRE